jgi:hypothetical protein
LRKAIALFLTLIFMIIVLGIVGAVIGIYKEVSKNTFEKDISQNSVLIINIKSVLDKFVKDINGSDIKNIYGVFPATNKDGTFKVLITIKPIMDKINLNEYVKKDKEKIIDTFLDNILEYYQIKDPVFFKALILDTIDKDDIERVGESEIKLKDKFFKNGKIYNYSHFKRILDYYVKYSEDKNIYKIPWRKLVYFSDKDYSIDCNIINKKVAKFLGLSFNEENLNCKELEKNEENKNILQKLSIIPFNKTIPYLINIELNYSNHFLNIYYDINKKRIENIESNFLY